MKTHRIKEGVKIQVGEKKTRLFLVPRDRAEGVVRLLQDFEVEGEQAAVPWRNAFKDLTEKYGEAGLALQGARTKEGLSQTELSQKTGIPQSHLSDMENGRRSIGKKIAKRLSKALRVDYKVFLS